MKHMHGNNQRDKKEKRIEFLSKFIGLEHNKSSGGMKGVWWYGTVLCLSRSCHEQKRRGLTRSNSRDIIRELLCMQCVMAGVAQPHHRWDADKAEAVKSAGKEDDHPSSHTIPLVEIRQQRANPLCPAFFVCC